MDSDRESTEMEEPNLVVQVKKEPVENEDIKVGIKILQSVQK